MSVIGWARAQMFLAWELCTPLVSVLAQAGSRSESPDIGYAR